MMGGFGEEGDGKDRGRGFGIRRMGMARKRMIVSLSLTSPEPITLPISTLFWTSLLSLLIAVLISFFKNFAMVRCLSVSSGILFPLISAILRQSRVSRKDSDLREFVRVTGASYATSVQPRP
jgi:hypothetical protein